MKPLIHIYGASGSGTSTLGRYLAQRLDFAFLDADDYFWLPTDPKFTKKRPIEQRAPLMQQDIAKAENGAVVSGSLVGWGDALIPKFTLAVRVVTDTPTRLARIKQREYARFGSRILPGGDMHEHHLSFCNGQPGTITAALRRAARPGTIHGRKRCAVRFWLWTARRLWTKRQPAWRNCYDLQTDP